MLTAMCTLSTSARHATRRRKKKGRGGGQGGAEASSLLSLRLPQQSTDQARRCLCGPEEEEDCERDARVACLRLFCFPFPGTSLLMRPLCIRLLPGDRSTAHCCISSWRRRPAKTTRRAFIFAVPLFTTSRTQHAHLFITNRLHERGVALLKLTD